MSLQSSLNILREKKNKSPQQHAVYLRNLPPIQNHTFLCNLGREPRREEPKGRDKGFVLLRRKSTKVPEMTKSTF